MSGPLTVTINLDLDGYVRRWNDRTGEIDTDSLEDVIVHLAAADLLNHVAPGFAEQHELRETLTRRVNAVTGEMIRARVEPLVEAALAEPIQKTDQWGSPVGQPTTMRAEILRLAQEHINKPFDQYHPEKGSRLQQFISQEVKAVIDGEFKAALNEARAEISAAAKDRAAELIAESITKLAGIRP